MNVGTQGANSASTTPSTRALILYYVACYIVLVAYGAATMLLLFSLRTNLLSMALLLRVNPWVLRAIDNFGILLLGLCWLLAFVAVEGYFRHGIHKGLLGRRVGKTFLIVGLCTLSSMLLNWLL